MSNVHRSAYRTAIAQGYRWLRFEPELERRFQDFYLAAHLVRIRLAGLLAIGLFAAFVLIDISTLPESVWRLTASMRIGLIVVFAAGIAIGYSRRWRGGYQTPLLIGAMAGSLGTVAIIATALRLGYPIPYEGILLAPSFLHLILCLPWRRALLANAITLVAFIALEIAYRPDPQTRFYHIIFLCAATGIAAYGGYFLEYTSRTNFLVHGLLNELAERDELTGMFNRRTLNAHLERVWRQGLRTGEGLAIAMIDVDYFKRYNDRYGHAQGDAALKAVADVIAGQARRPLDLAARYGGEEFVVVWYHPSPPELAHMGEQLVANVRALGLSHADSESGELSVSVGIAAMIPIAGRSYSELLSAADTALFQAKHEGRDRVVSVMLPQSTSAN